MKIVSLFITVAFLVSATGVFYINHTCLHSGTSKIVLSQEYDCCMQLADESSCCSAPVVENKCMLHEYHPNCCIYDIVYLKDDSDYLKSEIGLTFKILDYQLFEIKAPGLIASSEHFNVHIPKPPYYKSQRDILLKNNILIL